MKIFERHKGLMQGKKEGYCIGLFPPNTMDPYITLDITNSYLKKFFPAQVFYHQWMPVEGCICVSVGFPLEAHDSSLEELVRETVRRWFRCLDSFGAKGAASIAYGGLIFSHGERLDKFAGYAYETAINWFSRLQDERELPRDQHILAANPKADDLLRLRMPMAEVAADPEQSWAVLHYARYHDAFLSGTIKLVKP